MTSILLAESSQRTLTMTGVIDDGSEGVRTGHAILNQTPHTIEIRAFLVSPLQALQKRPLMTRGSFLWTPVP